MAALSLLPDCTTLLASSEMAPEVLHANTKRTKGGGRGDGHVEDGATVTWRMGRQGARAEQGIRGGTPTEA